MATLILTAVGTAVGGPIGGAVGALIGQQADALIFAPKARQGPRLGDLSVQTSSYGTAIPKIFGRMRVAGTVIWATDLKETAASGGGGKGQPRATSYAYSASLAVALSGRPIGGVGRIWADGKLLRGAAGDFKVATGFRLYTGDENQPVDPLIAAAEDGATPAFRGHAYAVFEDLALAEFGNRIPSLSFEVEADAGAVSIGTMCEELSAGAVSAGDTPALAGFAASGDSVRGAIEGLVRVVPVSLVDDGETLRLTRHAGLAADLPKGGASAGEVGGRTEITRRAATSAPGEVGIVYHDAARDWQTGMQRATLQLPGAAIEEVALPAALDAGAAKGLAEARLAALAAARTGALVNLSWAFADLRPGALVRLEGEAGLWKVERCALEHMLVRCELVQVRGGTLPVPAASPGRPVREDDHVHGATVLALVEPPSLDASTASAPRLLLAAAGAEPGWRRAALEASFDGGASWSAIGGTALPAVIGSAMTALGPGASALIDAGSTVEVQLLHEDMWLTSCTDDALVSGANLAILGDELLQFGSATAIGAGRFRLERLVRGRRGTEWGAALHAIGDRFVLLDAATSLAIEAPDGAIGGTAQVLARGVGDAADGVLAARTISGEALRPPAPVHLRAAIRANGDVAIGWVRRSRLGWSWLDGGDAPLGEESERYRVALSGVGFTRTVETATPALVYTAAEQAADGGGALTISIVQLGTAAASRPATLSLERS